MKLVCTGLTDRIDGNTTGAVKPDGLGATTDNGYLVNIMSGWLS